MKNTKCAIIIIHNKIFIRIIFVIKTNANLGNKQLKAEEKSLKSPVIPLAKIATANILVDGDCLKEELLIYILPYSVMT